MKKRKRPGKRNQNQARQHKDTLFCFIFRDKEKLLKLYNALNGTDHQNVDDLVVTTLEDVIYMGYKNDVSCLLDYTLFLGEHQSTWNPNMCLRGLLYFSRLYSEYVHRKGYDVHGRKQILLPYPQYYVFYNGNEDRPERTVLHLSDSYRTERAAGEIACGDRLDEEKNRDRPALECSAVVLNINYGRNRKLMEQCRPLMEYACFVQTVRDFIADGCLPELAVDRAVDRCLEQNILTDILRAHRKEVTKLFLTEYDEELHKYWEKKWREEEVAEARKQAREQGRKETQEEKEKGIMILIQTMQELECTRERTLDQVTAKFSISREEALAFVDKYWK